MGIDFKSIDADMEVKDGNGRQTGISAYIREVLHSIPPGKAVLMSALAKDLVEQGKVKDPHQAYIRINNAMKSDDGQKNFVRFVDRKDNYTYIGWKPQGELAESMIILPEPDDVEGENDESASPAELQ